MNVAHIARHGVIPDEVEQVCRGEHVGRATYADRIMLIGLTQDARALAVVLEPEGDDVYHPVTARPASRRERRIYREEKRG